ncbi:FAD/NAD(P)-binding protein [Gemmata sp.]|uniref:FAD/NAD(P)-binding protein n=1 Tax=Gemmata sp. TaxID=1914242 RepID=UPI003F6FED70
MHESFTVAVVGAGFSGVMTAAHLLRARAAAPVRVVMVNRSGVFARGVAYGTNSAAHLLNVPAGRMSAYPDDPGHFARFASARDPAVTPATFVRRSVYGEYLEDTLTAAVAGGAPNALEQVVAGVRSVEPGPDGVTVTTEFGERIRADRVVLAVGNYPPTHPPGLPGAFLASPRYVRDPWKPGALDAVPRGAPVLLVGTGLTMYDVALDLHARGVPGALAVSRRGLLPRPHDPAVPPAEPAHRPPGIEAAGTVVALARAVRQQVRAVSMAGGDWRQVLDSLRPITPAIWQRLEANERAKFLRHLRPYWDVHRHRTAPEIWDGVDRLRQQGWLRVRPCRLLGAKDVGGSAEVSFGPRGTDSVECVSVGAVVNCTGPATDVRAAGDALLEDLFRRGLAQPDPLGLGIEVAADGKPLGATGKASPVLYYVGPLVRARDGEGTAVPELRVQAQHVAHALLDSIGERRAAV